MPAARPTDPDVTAVYTAEDRLERWFGLGTVTVFGTSWALEPEVRFGQVADVQRYVTQVLNHLESRGWSTPSTSGSGDARAGNRVGNRVGQGSGSSVGSPSSTGTGGSSQPAVTVPSLRVRARAGSRKAHYEQGRDTIALPGAEHGTSWALREAVVLHEIAHHLHFHGVRPPAPNVSAASHTPTRRGEPRESASSTFPGNDSRRSPSHSHEGSHPSDSLRGSPFEAADSAPHGRDFRATLLALYRDAGHPTAATLLSIAFAEEGLS